MEAQHGQPEPPCSGACSSPPCAATKWQTSRADAPISPPSDHPSTSAAPAAWHPGDPYTVILFYRYAQLGDAFAASLLEQVRAEAARLGLAGRVLLAPEGVNGTLAGSEPCIAAFIAWFEGAHPAFVGMDWKRSAGSAAQKLPFPDLSVKLLREIINTGPARQRLDAFVAFDPHTFGGLSERSTGRHLTPRQFHEALAAAAAAPAQASKPAGSAPSAPEEPAAAAGSGSRSGLDQGGGDGQPACSCSPPSSSTLPPLVVDVRNNYEHRVGHFQGAVGLDVTVYSDSWKLLDDLIERHNLRTTPRPILMYCTGGIRCEKASAYVRAAGVDGERVFQLRGGIHRYLEEFPDGGLFKGKNIVFDARYAMAAAGPPAADAPPSDGAVAAGGGEAESGQREEDETEEEEEDEGLRVVACVYCPPGRGTVPGDVPGRCTVCNAVCLACEACHAAHVCQDAGGEYHCRRHQHLRDLYFTSLSRFGAAELRRQRDGLVTVLASTGIKSRRRMLRRQIGRLDDALRRATGGGNGCGSGDGGSDR